MIAKIRNICAALTASVALAPSAALAQVNLGEFEIAFSNGIQFDHNSEDAKVREAGPEVVRVQGDFGFSYPEVFFQPRNLDDEPVTRTEDISEGGYSDRDMVVHFYTEIAGQRTQIHCQNAQEGTGWAERTELSDTHVSMNFEVEVTECFDGEDNAVDYDKLPFLVTGTISHQICGMFMPQSC